MDKLIDVLEKMVPIVSFFPSWAKILFVLTFLALMISITTFVLLYFSASKQAADNEELTSIGFDLSVMQASPDSDNPFHSGDVDLTSVSYIRTSSPDAIAITHSVPYLTLLQKGGPIKPISFSYSPFRFRLPNLDLKIVNNSKNTYFFTDALLEVTTSESDRQPVIVMRSDDSGMNAQHIAIMNDGWGDVIDPVLRISVAAPGSAAPNWSPVEEFSFSTFSEDANVDISRLIGAAGADLQRLASLQICKKSFGATETTITTVGGSGYQQEFLSEASYDRELEKALGPFKNNVALVRGEIIYSSPGSALRQQVAIETTVGIMRTMRAGAPAPPSYQYQALLHTSGSNYVVDVPISQVIKPGDTDRFNIMVAASESSSHHFRVRLKYNGNKELVSLPVFLNLFVPRSAVSLLEANAPNRKTTGVYR